MNEKFNKNAKVEKFTNMLGIAVCVIVIDPLSKGNNSYKSRSSVTKFELDLYYVMTISHTKSEVNISKDCREKSGKLKREKGRDLTRSYEKSPYTNRYVKRAK